MPFIIGVDIGGTFTDAVAIETSMGAVLTSKARTTPKDLVQGVVNALDLVADQGGMNRAELLADCIKFAHGTTQTSNVMLTWTGARTGLLATRGFGDELLMMLARGRVAGVGLSERRHFRATDKPVQLVPKWLIEEVAERVDHHGRPIVRLTEAEARRAVGALLDKDVEAVAVALLWSPANNEAELLLERVLREQAPDVYVSLSHRLAPVLGEYERTVTATVNAYVGPTMERYLQRLSTDLSASGLTKPLLVLQANGGVAQVDRIMPVNTIESGPAAGMVATKMLADAAGYRNIIATDVGGTTFKVGLLVDGQWSFAPELTINQYTILAPAIDIVSIGAGGGSIAWVDDTRLRIGPQSAAADPGPASYGWGGTEPTVTDADVVLGFIDPSQFLGGRLKLRADLAERAIKERIADQLFDGDVLRAAAGIRQVVDAQMGDLVRKMTIERGHDPRQFVLVAYGGAGPLHAAHYANGVGARQVIVPPEATVYSALGAAASDIHHSLVRSVTGASDDHQAAVEELFAAMEKEATEMLDRQGVDAGHMAIVRWAEMRYDRQLHDLRVKVPPDARNGGFAQAVRRAFEERYVALYGTQSILAGAAIRVLRVGIEATGFADKPAIEAQEASASDSQDAARSEREIFWPEAGHWLHSHVWDGTKLRPGYRLAGPGVIERPGTTVALPPGVLAEIDRFGNTVITLGIGKTHPW